MNEAKIAKRVKRIERGNRKSAKCKKKSGVTESIL
jgi:hypothetical protein